ncbi:calcineurin-like phosphoesterase superfamily domain protein [Cellulophaga phage Nekkels_1]|uniref:Calcineurin-like phosphoesterase superfamily domain protein n=1 Tax=Cellulophaga phage Nekkels_1 TaxID=2745692 RepID=A0A8E4UXJ2_9CAUD|nr:calcineurin-like phosphoesterase superfamily domain protein [Cellulophaga phage Nekkels_1]QQO97076.1 calcineurin-like phosphoesterase superfamily domain protein [Cellulophaga phage Nekkels_1]QQO97171.1 calcineurin-like phosphoesterase superfamily domain protein [Cellulophaga phage Nekkels_2]
MGKTQKRLYDYEAELLGIKPKKHQKGRNQAKYYLSKKQLEFIRTEKMKPSGRKFVETAKKYGKKGELISRVEKLETASVEVPEGFEIIKITNTPYTTGQFIQYAPKKVEESVNEIDFEKIISKYVKPIVLNPISIDSGIYSFDRLVYTDVHIGMETNSNGYSLYGGKWNDEEQLKRLDSMINHVLINKKSNTLFIDDLGDFMDGWDAETTRKGHSLPQNMDNEKAFDTGLLFKVKLLDSLASQYSRIIVNNICEDNHSGSFGYVVNSAFKQIIEERYSHITINNVRKFIDHYVYDKNCFIISHGKDSKNLKFGFKPVLDTKQIEKISNYIKEHKLHDYIIEFSKGDSHQKIFDESTSDDFDYYNYPAFSPSSEWVQTNFKKGFSGFEFFNFKKDGQKVHIPYKFVWNSGREESTIDYSK